MSDIIPTIGRRIWFFPGTNTPFVDPIDQLQPCDAGIVFVHPNGNVKQIRLILFGVCVSQLAGCLGTRPNASRNLRFNSSVRALNVRFPNGRDQLYLAG